MKKLLILLLISQAVLAQNYTLKKCIEVATAHNPTYKKAFLNAELANANVSAAKARKLPQTQLGISQGMNFGRSIDRFSNDYINQLYNSTYGGLQVSMPIFKGFQRQYLVESAKFLEDAETYSIETEKNRLSFNMLKIYLEVLAAKEVVLATEKQLENAKIQLQRQEKQMAAGISGKLEQLQFANQVATSTGSVIDAQTNHKIARLALFQLMNQQPDDSIDFEPIGLPNGDLSGSFEGELNPATFLPEYKSLALQTQSFDKQIRANKAEKMPEINLFGNYSTFYASTNPERNFFQQFNDTRNGSVSLNLSIPIFSKFLVQPRTQQLTIQKKMIENTIETNKNALRQEIETAKLLLGAFAERFKNSSKSVEISKENLKLVELRIEAGTINPIEFTLAQSTLERAIAEQIQSKYRWILQKKILTFYQLGEFDFL